MGVREHANETSTGAALSKRRGPRVWGLVLWGLGLLVLLVMLLWFFVLPGMLRSRVVDALESAGLTNVTIGDTELSPSRIVLKSIAAGTDARLRIGSVHVTMSLATLIEARVDTIGVEDVDLRLSAESPLQGLWQAPASQPRPGARTETDETDRELARALLPDLPFSSLRISNLHVARPLARGEVTIDGDLAVHVLRLKDGTDLHASVTCEASAAGTTLGVELQTTATPASSGLEVAFEGHLHGVTATESKDDFALDGVVRAQRSEGGGLRGTIESKGKGALATSRNDITIDARALEVGIEGEFDSSRDDTFHLRAALDMTDALVVRLGSPERPTTCTFTGQVAAEVQRDTVVQVRNANVTVVPSSPETKRIEIQGLGASLRPLAVFDPAATVTHEVHWESVHASTKDPIELGRGTVIVRLPSKDRFEIVSLNQATGVDRETTGWVRVRDLTVVRGAERFDVDASLDHVVVQPWLDRVAPSRVRSNARVSGEVRAVVAFAPSAHVTLVGGHLAATEPGRLEFARDTETTEVLEPYVRQIAASAIPGHEQLAVDRILGAVRDFRYDVLRADIDTEQGESGSRPVLRLQAQGRGSKVPQELDVTVLVHGVQDLLDMAFDVQQAVDNAKQDAAQRIGSRKGADTQTGGK
ncbi:MAG: hypothetical protein KDC95_13880 [Planctomycetes bacterium]|nr:hypothetical protein [Planctomycetota bacterium]